MTKAEAQINENFEVITDKNYKLRPNDRIKAKGDTFWFPVAEFDVGVKASFYKESGWSVEKHIKK